jgi:monoamine oxidase
VQHKGELAGHREVDVAVVGGGLAGLMAARVVACAALEPVVLEARDRIGGRVVDETLGVGAVVEMGGQYVGARHRRLRTLLTELGIELSPVYDRGLHLLELERGTRRYRGEIPLLGASTLLDLARARWRIDRRSRHVPTSTPWDAPNARQADATTLGTWLEGSVRTPDARAILAAAIRMIWGEDPHGVNMLAALTFVKTAGSFQALGATRGGLLQDRVVGGSAVLAQALAARVGDRILYRCPVDRIVDHGDSVEVESRSVRVTARQVIVAVPPALVREIRLEPALPAARQLTLERLPMGAVIKVAAIYDRPFWRDRGLSGRALCVEGPVTGTLDNSPPAGRPGVLVGFAPGAGGRWLGTRSPSQRREAFLGSFERLFGAGAARPEQYVEKDWTADRWSRGCYFGLPARGAVTDLLATFAQPTGSIHWAGAETAFGSYGSMDGALQSGERAAEAVLSALASRHRPGRGPAARRGR